MILVEIIPFQQEEILFFISYAEAVTERTLSESTGAYVGERTTATESRIRDNEISQNTSFMSKLDLSEEVYMRILLSCLSMFTKVMTIVMQFSFSR